MATAVLLRLDRPADAAIRAWFRANPQVGGRDRAFVADTVFAVLRHLGRLEFLAQSRSPRKVVLSALVLLFGRHVRALQPHLRTDEGAWLASIKERSAALPPHTRLSLPEWLYARLLVVYGAEETERIGLSLLEPAPLDLRVNTLLARRDETIATLRASGIEASATAISPTGVRLRGKPSLERHILFKSGHVEVQDEGSQLVALLAEPRRGQMIVDFCAGAGGKTLALGAMMRSEGRIYAFDTSERRLANLKPRLKRSGLSNVHPQLIDSENDVRVKRLAGKIDSVLVDAPCSGTGTLRRNPDLKWRIDEPGVVELTVKQGAILRAAARLPKVGGRLVYATCSLLPEENEMIVADFLTRSPGWKRVDVRPILERFAVTVDGTDDTLRLLPHRHGTDGFFAAILERTA
ncbi:MAG: RsmB/NOP family class I SAM-dependent RNA methyltransferase [Betaproteobacteria bacterium]|nr:RsmB/NOP family class I SAM-dependent RNA methyltransferase [Betaproteobacteria bacterium]MBL8533921.1 RsmB/NOP family class I SAM-dependent RNA methyltransferase [Betaproteobacteria bacterium]